MIAWIKRLFAPRPSYTVIASVGEPVEPTVPAIEWPTELSGYYRHCGPAGEQEWVSNQQWPTATEIAIALSRYRHNA